MIGCIWQKILTTVDVITWVEVHNSTTFVSFFMSFASSLREWLSLLLMLLIWVGRSLIKALLHCFLAVSTKESTYILRPDGGVQLLDCGFINGVSFVGCLSLHWWYSISRTFLINSSLSWQNVILSILVLLNNNTYDLFLCIFVAKVWIYRCEDRKCLNLLSFIFAKIALFLL